MFCLRSEITARPWRPPPTPVMARDNIYTQPSVARTQVSRGDIGCVS